MSGPVVNVTLIKDLKPGMQNLTIQAIVVEIGRSNTVKDSQEVRTVKIADKSGMVNLSLWNEPGKVLQTGDIIRLTRSYTSMFMSCLTVYLAKSSEFFKIGEFCMLFSEMPYLSEPNVEMAAQFEKDDAERKATRAINMQGGTGKPVAAGQPRPTPPTGTAGKTWGTQGNQASRGGTSSAQGTARPPHKGAGKDKR